MYSSSLYSISSNIFLCSFNVFTVSSIFRLAPDWNPDSEEYFCRTYALPAKIGDGCWIGGGAIILPWVSIGEGTVIGAGSVVTKNIPSNCVAVGNPCRVIKRINGESRFKSCYPHEKKAFHPILYRMKGLFTRHNVLSCVCQYK